MENLTTKFFASQEGTRIWVSFLTLCLNKNSGAIMWSGRITPISRM